MTEQEQQQLIDDHFLFDKPVSPLLLASGMARDWPDARGIWWGRGGNRPGAGGTQRAVTHLGGGGGVGDGDTQVLGIPLWRGSRGTQRPETPPGGTHILVNTPPPAATRGVKRAPRARGTHLEAPKCWGSHLRAKGHPESRVPLGGAPTCWGPHPGGGGGHHPESGDPTRGIWGRPSVRDSIWGHPHIGDTPLEGFKGHPESRDPPGCMTGAPRCWRPPPFGRE